MKVHYGKVYIPHLNYTVNVKRFKPCEEMPNAQAYVRSNGKHSCDLYSPEKVANGDLAHELVHVLQFISLNRNMDFQLEFEHFGYLMHFLFMKISGSEWA